MDIKELIYMSRITTTQLRQKDVINLCDGARLGCITEVEFDTVSGQICSFILTRTGGLLGFSKECPLVLPWSRIECIGEDAILVKISASEFDCFCRDLKRQRRE